PPFPWSSCARHHYRALALVTSTKWRDAEIARSRLETLAQRLGHGDPVLGAVLPLEMALLPGQPDALDSRPPLRGTHGADRGVALALECRRRRERLDRHRNDGMAGIGGLALLLDKIDDVAPERRLIERAGQQSRHQAQPIAFVIADRQQQALLRAL